ncbi:protein kinase [bacterium]|nr:protein kinase [candidate division CSSED10-310 bacterium]
MNKLSDFKLGEVIGKGGMGVVYRAIHLPSGANAAVKTVTAAGERHINSIRREIAALTLLKHPGIVRFFSHGIDNGIPWYAMEYVQGTPFHLIIEPVTACDTLSTEENSAETASAPTWELILARLSIVQRLCPTLAFLHGKGVVHRDLKPANIIVKHDGMPVLVDFGITSRFGGKMGRESLEIPDVIAGTLPYMAPEQIRGEFLDPRADLYALGCILYEALTNINPFRGGNYLQIAQAHLVTVPMAPSKINSCCPSILDKLVLRLLEKEPKHRMGYAMTVSGMLEEAGVQSDFHLSFPEVMPYLFRPDFTGRDYLLQVLLDRLNQNPSGNGTRLFVKGESGIGKTRLALEIANHLKSDVFRIFVGTCSPVIDSYSRVSTVVTPSFQPFKTLFQSIADRCRLLGENETQRLLGSAAPLLGVIDSEFQHVPGYRKMQSFPEIPDGEATFRLFHALASTLANFFKKSPGILIIDDIHHIDTMTVAFLKYLTRAGMWENINVHLLGLFNPDECNDAFQDFLSVEDIEMFDLKKLTEKDMEILIKDMLSVPTLSSSFTHFFYSYAEGNPFFLNEYVMAAVDTGLIYRNRKGDWETHGTDISKFDIEASHKLPLPASIKDVIETRLKQVQGRSRSVLEFMAVIGSEIPHSVLSIAASTCHTEWMADVNDIINRRLVEETTSGDYHFTHGKIRDIVYASVPSEKRVEIHKIVAESMESLFKSVPSRYGTIGYHWQEAGYSQKAAAYFKRGGEAALQRYALQEAEYLFNLFLETQSQFSKDTARIQIKKALNIHLVQGRTEEALANLHEIHRLIEDLTDVEIQITVLNALSTVYVEGLGNLAFAKNTSIEALRLIQQSGNKEKEGEVLGNLAMITSAMGDPEQAKRYCRTAIAIHKEQHMLRLEGRATYQLALISHMQHRYQEALSLYQKASLALTHPESKRDLGLCYQKMSAILAENGASGEAFKLCESALFLFKSIKDRRLEAITLHDLGSLHETEGNLDLAKQFYQSAGKIFREIGNRRDEGVSLACSACLSLSERNLDEAEGFCKSAIKLFQDIQDLRCEAVAWSDLARINDARGLWDKAWELYQKSLRMLEKASHRVQIPYVHLALAILARKMNLNLDKAEYHCKLASDIFEEQKNHSGLILSLCESGQIVLARGEKLNPFLVEQLKKTIRLHGKNSEISLKETVDSFFRAFNEFKD